MGRCTCVAGFAGEICGDIVKVVPDQIAQRALQLTAALNCRSETNSTLSNCPDTPYICGATCTANPSTETKMEFHRTAENVTLSPFSMSDQLSNDTAGAIVLLQSVVTVSLSKIENNINTASGSAGIYACDLSTLNVHHTDFVQNQVQSVEGLASGSSSIFCHSSAATVTNSRCAPACVPVICPVILTVVTLNTGFETIGG